MSSVRGQIRVLVDGGGAECRARSNVGSSAGDLEKWQKNSRRTKRRVVAVRGHSRRYVMGVNASALAKGVGTRQLRTTRFALRTSDRADARALGGVARLVVPGDDQLGMEVHRGRLRRTTRPEVLRLHTTRPRLDQQQSGERRRQALDRYDGGHTTSIVTPVFELEDLLETIFTGVSVDAA